MALIDVIILVDATNLIESIQNGLLSVGSVSAPQSLGSWEDSDLYIYMIAKRGIVYNDQEGKSELEIIANVGDSIRWTMSTFGNNSEYTAFIYASEFTPFGSMSAAEYSNREVKVYLPGGKDPNSTLKQYTNYIYSPTSKILQGNVIIQYTLSFQLVDNETGDVIGYFSWDPFIKVNT